LSVGAAFLLKFFSASAAMLITFYDDKTLEVSFDERDEKGERKRIKINVEEEIRITTRSNIRPQIMFFNLSGISNYLLCISEDRNLPTKWFFLHLLVNDDAGAKISVSFKQIVFVENETDYPEFNHFYSRYFGKSDWFFIKKKQHDNLYLIKIDPDAVLAVENDDIKVDVEKFINTNLYGKELVVEYERQENDEDVKDEKLDLHVCRHTVDRCICQYSNNTPVKSKWTYNLVTKSVYLSDKINREKLHQEDLKFTDILGNSIYSCHFLGEVGKDDDEDTDGMMIVETTIDPLTKEKRERKVNCNNFLQSYKHSYVVFLESNNDSVILQLFVNSGDRKNVSLFDYDFVLTAVVNFFFETFEIIDNQKYNVENPIGYFLIDNSRQEFKLCSTVKNILGKILVSDIIQIIIGCAG
jgi:hypothetical protein